jgi:hypothetical protein
MAKKKVEKKVEKKSKKVEKKVIPVPVAVPVVSSVPKNFMIRCMACRWARTTTGLKADLADLHEIKNNTTVPGRHRKFLCPGCGKHAVMKRIVRGK